eukprot:1189928-Prorocentrum_minimum.AAC.3
MQVTILHNNTTGHSRTADPRPCATIRACRHFSRKEAASSKRADSSDVMTVWLAHQSLMTTGPLRL